MGSGENTERAERLEKMRRKENSDLSKIAGNLGTGD